MKKKPSQYKQLHKSWKEKAKRIFSNEIIHNELNFKICQIQKKK